MTQNSTARGPIPSGSTSTPPPGFNAFSAFSPAPGSSTSTPQLPAASAFSAPPKPAPASDPFSILSTTSKPATPKPSTPQPSSTLATQVATNDDDEWSFSSALPSMPSEHKAVVSNTSLKIELTACRPSSPALRNAMQLYFYFGNNTDLPISDLHFQLAVTKVCLRPQPPP